MDYLIDEMLVTTETKSSLGHTWGITAISFLLLCVFENFHNKKFKFEKKDAWFTMI